MNHEIVRSKTPVSLVGGGFLGLDDLKIAVARAPMLVAADGGAGAALAAGLMPFAVIGDLDSLTPEDRTQIPPERIFHVAEQDSTDFSKALSRISAPLVLAVGFLGNRIDHQLATLNALVRLADRPCVLIGAHEVIFHLPRDFRVDLHDGDVVSLFPLARVRGRSTGLVWPIDGLDLAPDARVGTSNRALGAVRIETEGDGLLAVLPRRALDAVMRAFERAPAQSGPHREAQ